MHARMRERVHFIHHQRRYLLCRHWIVLRQILTSETASEKCQQEKRKTVNGEDILFAMTSLGFENYGEALKIYLARYREVTIHIARYLWFSLANMYCRILSLAESTKSHLRPAVVPKMLRPQATITTCLGTPWTLPRTTPPTSRTVHPVVASTKRTRC